MLGIVILNYNTWEESIDCIKSIIKYTYKPHKIYLVDNCSPKQLSQDQLRTLENDKVEIIFNNQNSGYAAGNNVGLRKAYEDGCNQFIISNSDVLLIDNSFDKMSDFVEKNSEVGIVGPLIYNVQNKLQPIHMLTKLTAVGKIKNMMLSTSLRPLFTKFQKSFVQYNVPSAPLKVFGVSGCCFLVTRKCYEEVFPFDENTFLYEEEYILGCRLERKEIRAYVLPTAQIVHAEAVSTGGMSDFSYKCLIDSEQYYLKEYIHSGVAMRWLIRCIRRLNWHLAYKRARGK